MKKTNFFTNARIYAQGQNLLTFTKFSGLDPEAFTNMYQAQYPMSRQYSFGFGTLFLIFLINESTKNEKYKNISAHGHSGIQHHCLFGQVSG